MTRTRTRVPVTELPREHALRAQAATIARVGAPLADERLAINREQRAVERAERDEADAIARQAEHRAKLAAEIAAAAPLLTPEQREMLRPILAGTLDTIADSTSAA